MEFGTWQPWQSLVQSFIHSLIQGTSSECEMRCRPHLMNKLCSQGGGALVSVVRQSGGCVAQAHAQVSDAQERTGSHLRMCHNWPFGPPTTHSIQPRWATPMKSMRTCLQLPPTLTLLQAHLSQGLSPLPSLTLTVCSWPPHHSPISS